MSRSAKEWAIRERFRIITELGGKCRNPKCGETKYEKLTFDHIFGKDWEATGLSTDQRMCRYKKEHKLGLLQLLCLSCNSKRGDPRFREEQAKARLIMQLGEHCANECEGVYIGDLEFVHVDPDWKPVDVHGDDRTALYAYEIRKGNMSILCPACRALSDNYVVSLPKEEFYNEFDLEPVGTPF